MNKLLTLLAAATLSAAATAQTMKVYQGRVITAFPAATAADIVYTQGGTTFSVMGQTFSTASVDQIRFDRSETPESTVSVAYEADGAWVTVSGNVAPQLAVSVRGGHVSVLAHPALAEEVTYDLSGTSTAGSFYMDGEFKSTLRLDNLQLTNPDSAAVNIANGKRINVILPEGTTTTLADGAAGGGLQKACLFINGHAEFSGAGTLRLTGNVRHAYASDEYTLINPGFGTIEVLASANDGLHVDQYFRMDGGTVSVSGVQGDGIDVSLTKDATDEYNGQVFLNGGTLRLAVTADDVKGVKSEGDMTVAGGNISAEVSGLGTKGFSVGGNLLITESAAASPVITMNVTGTTYMKDTAMESKCRGIKVKGNYTLDGGTISMSVTGQKAKGISVDGTYTYKKGTTNVQPE